VAAQHEVNFGESLNDLLQRQTEILAVIAIEQGITTAREQHGTIDT
jgi:hypothetical protein